MVGGEIADINEARKVIANSEPIAYYEPENQDAWEDAYKRYLEVIARV